MAGPDPKWLEILKASGLQTTALSAACGAFLLLIYLGIIPPKPEWVVPLTAFAGLVCFCLAVSSWFHGVYKWVKPILKRWYARRRAQRDLINYIPYMTNDERKIISYLLHHNQKTFSAAADGGYAATLLARNIVIIIGQPGQHIHMEDVPMTIPDGLWDILMIHKNEFPYTPPSNSEVEPHPWRVSWMVR